MLSTTTATRDSNNLLTILVSSTAGVICEFEFMQKGAQSQGELKSGFYPFNLWRMKTRPITATLIMLVLGHAGLLCAQSKITTVSAMRVRSGPQTTAQEITRLKLGTVVNATERSSNQDTVGGKT